MKIEMQLITVRVICAIGQSGQLGLDGKLPWEGNRSPPDVADVARFFDLTIDHVLIAGPKSIASVPEFARIDREFFTVRSSMDPQETLQRLPVASSSLEEGRQSGTLMHLSLATGM